MRSHFTLIFFLNIGQCFHVLQFLLPPLFFFLPIAKAQLCSPFNTHNNKSVSRVNAPLTQFYPKIGHLRNPIFYLLLYIFLNSAPQTGSPPRSLGKGRIVLPPSSCCHGNGSRDRMDLLALCFGVHDDGDVSIDQGEREELYVVQVLVWWRALFRTVRLK